MKRLCLPFLLISATLGFARSPKIVCDNPIYNFGAVPLSQTIEHTFKIRNEGDGPLIISGTKTACGCTVAKITEDTVPPGGSTEIMTTLNLKGRKGKMTKNIMVFSNDPNHKTLKLSLKGEAKALFEVLPNRVNFGTVIQGESKAVVLEIVFHDTPNSITKVKTHSEHYQVRLETVEEGVRYELHATMLPTAPAGGFNNLIYLENTLGSKNTINIQVAANIVGDISINPQQITLSDKGGKPESRYIVVRPGRIKGFKVTGVEFPDPDVMARAIPMPDGGFRILISNLIAKESLDGQYLVLKTDHAEHPEFNVPIRYAKRP